MVQMLRTVNVLALDKNLISLNINSCHKIVQFTFYLFHLLFKNLEISISNLHYILFSFNFFPLPVKPIFSSLSNNSKKRNVLIGDSVIFKQCFYSHPKSDVKWQINEKLINFNKYLITDFVSRDFPFKGSCTILKVEDIKDNDNSTYTLIVENSLGKEMINFVLTPEGKLLHVHNYSSIIKILFHIIQNCLKLINSLQSTQGSVLN